MTARGLEGLRDFQRDGSWDFDELCELLQQLGFEMRISGSHHFFRRAGITEAIHPRHAFTKRGIVNL
ncbi:MAG: type II toxin-antitoxin system HicA family toxin [Chthoniobacterales bacterium]